MMHEWILTVRRHFRRGLESLPLTGPVALLTALALVAVPTGVRAVVDGAVMGCEFTPYLAFVLVGALLLRWWLAGAIALASVAIMGGLFFAPVGQSTCFLSSASMFLASSAAIIGIVLALRGVITAMQRRGGGKSANDIVFSLHGNEVWAGWNGEDSQQRLGSRKSVTDMMKDFLAQEELGERLNRRR